MTRPDENIPRPATELPAVTPVPEAELQPSGQEIELYISRAVAGEAAAFSELYRLYADNIYRYLFFRVRLDSDAQDLTAQVFLNAWQAIRRYRQQEVPFLVWLYAIARNLLINFNRQQRRHPQTALTDGLAGRLSSHEETNNPQSIAQRRAANEELVAAFERLNDEQQQVIFYRFVENWSHADLARLMGKSEGAVRAMQFRALETLRRLLAAP